MGSRLDQYLSFSGWEVFVFAASDLLRLAIQGRSVEIHGLIRFCLGSVSDFVMWGLN